MADVAHHQHFAHQRLKWVLVRDHANLVGYRSFLGYIKIQGTINFSSLCHSRVEDFQSIFSFRNNKLESLSTHVKKSKVKHVPFKV